MNPRIELLLVFSPLIVSLFLMAIAAFMFWVLDSDEAEDLGNKFAGGAAVMLFIQAATGIINFIMLG